MAKAPAWVDKGWAGFDRGPALQVPVNLHGGPGPYTTTTARVGDTVKFMKNRGATPARIMVIPGEIDPQAAGATTKKPPQQTNASLEDLIRTGFSAAADLNQEALTQVVSRSPWMTPYIAAPDGTGASIPTPVTVVTYVDVT